jgi:hypothetical protein
MRSTGDVRNARAAVNAHVRPRAMRYLVFLLTFVVSGCAHFDSTSESALARGALGFSVLLGELVLVPDSKVAVDLQISNRSVSTVRFCLIDSAPTFWIGELGSNARKAIQVGALVSDTDCAERYKLSPGQQMMLHESVAFPLGWSSGSATLGASLRGADVAGKRIFTLESTPVAVEIAAVQPNNSLERTRER